jgi:predicted RND superfamily exporter protein
LARSVDWLIRLRLPLLLFCLVSGALAYTTSQRLEFDRSVEGLFHKDDPRLLNYREDKRLFGGGETSLVAYADPQLLSVAGLERLEKLDASLANIPGVQGVLSLARARLPGSPLSSKSLRQHLADGSVDETSLRRELLDSNLYRGRLLSADGQTCILLVNLLPVEQATASRPETIEKIKQVCAAHKPQAIVAGGPVLIEEVYEQLELDGQTLGLASNLVLGAVIAILFRNVRWIVISLAVVQLTIIWTKALLVLSGRRMSMVSSPMVALVTVIGIATVVLVAMQYREDRDKHSPARALRQTFIELGPALLWITLTTAAGFASMMICRIVPVAEFGWMMALGSTLVLVAVLGLVPGGVLLGGVHTDPAKPPGEHVLGVWLDRTLSVIVGYPGWVSLAGLALLAVTLLGTFRLEIATDFDENFRESSRIVQAYRFLSDRMGTISMLDVMVDAPKPSQHEAFAQFLANLEAMQKDLAKQPGVTGTLSIADILDFVASTRPERAGAMEAVTAGILERANPAQRLVALQAIEPGIVSGLWNQEHNVVRVIVQIAQTRGSAAKLELYESIESIAGKRFPTARAAGVEILLTHSVQSLQTDQWSTFALSIAANILMMWAAFRSWRIALISLVPNAVAILMVVGVMGLAGLKMNMATAMLASVSMGMSIDFSIHYLYRYHRERLAGKPVNTALRDAQGTVGLAMVLSNVALIAGFLTLVLSAFVPTMHFGILISIAMLGGLLGNLTTLPLLLRVIDR